MKPTIQDSAKEAEIIFNEHLNTVMAMREILLTPMSEEDKLADEVFGYVYQYSNIDVSPSKEKRQEELLAAINDAVICDDTFDVLTRAVHGEYEQFMEWYKTTPKGSVPGLVAKTKTIPFYPLITVKTYVDTLTNLILGSKLLIEAFRTISAKAGTPGKFLVRGGDTCCSVKSTHASGLHNLIYPLALSSADEAMVEEAASVLKSRYHYLVRRIASLGNTDIDYLASDVLFYKGAVLVDGSTPRVTLRVVRMKDGTPKNAGFLALLFTAGTHRQSISIVI